MGCKNNSTNITTTLALGSIDSPYFLQVRIDQKLGVPVCETQVPIFNPTFSVVGYTEVGTGQYEVTVKVEGIIYYNPCGGNTCHTVPQKVSQTFTRPFASTTAPTSVTISAGTTVNTLVVAPRQNCTRDFVSVTPITLTVA